MKIRVLVHKDHALRSTHSAGEAGIPKCSSEQSDLYKATQKYCDRTRKSVPLSLDQVFFSLHSQCQEDVSTCSAEYGIILLN